MEGGVPRGVQGEGGGFDAVIGNPPYIRIQRIGHADSDYIFRTYESPTSKMDLSLVFLEKGLKLVKETARVGFICTSQWLTANYGQNLRRMFSTGSLHEVVDFGSLPVFQHVDTYPSIFILSPSAVKNLTYKNITSENQLNLDAINAALRTQIAFSTLSDAPWSLGGLDILEILQTANMEWKPLGEFAKSRILVVQDRYE